MAASLSHIHKVTVAGKEYDFSCSILENRELRRSLSKLSLQIFGLDFEPWYELGCWGRRYVPYVLADNGRVVSNVSVNIMEFIINGDKKQYIQIGTVMTHPDYTGRGLNRWLLEHVLEVYKDETEMIYLYANKNVTEYYPKFGFKECSEYESIISPDANINHIRKLDILNTEDKNVLLSKYSCMNPYAAVNMVDNTGLLMFYCNQFLKDSIYYLPAYDAVIIAEFNERDTIIYDIYTENQVPLAELLSAIQFEDKKPMKLGFPLLESNQEKAIIRKKDNDDNHLFIFSEVDNLFFTEKLMMPLLSKA